MGVVDTFGLDFIVLMPIDNGLIVSCNVPMEWKELDCVFFSCKIFSYLAPTFGAKTFENI